MSTDAYDTCCNTLADPVDHGGLYRFFDEKTACDFRNRFFDEKTAIFGISESVTAVPI
eukprot:COSAG02_NODE_1166_length_14154_cov_19.442191_9_plen_58_part_00